MYVTIINGCNLRTQLFQSSILIMDIATFRLKQPMANAVKII